MADRRDKPSSIALDECYSAEDDAFLDELRRFTAAKKLTAIADKWKVDPRPWARQMIREYLAEPLNSAGHETLVKRLFKHAEEERDDEMLGWFLVAFDRLIRRRRIRQHHYDYRTRETYTTERLWATSNQTPQGRMAAYSRPALRLFSNRTRHYLRRRAWRYFRRLSYSDGRAYRRAIVKAIKEYQDNDFAAGENIIDNWSLMHACYFGSPAIRFGVALVHLTDGHTLGDLAPAPYQPDLWKVPEAFEPLLELVARAKSSLVRQWAMELISRDHEEAVGRLEASALLPLLTHRDPRVQEFAASLFNRLPSLGSLPIETWLALLDADNLSVQTMLCQAMAEHVAPERLDKQQLIDLTNRMSAPVSRMGFELLQKRHAASPYSTAELADLADAQCQAVAGQITEWALQHVGTEAAYDVELVVRFFDSLQRSARDAAMTWLAAGTPGWDDPRLWARLIETPFPDVRDALIDRLEARVRLPGADADQLAPLWSTVILGVHRGGRQKPKAVRQIVGAIRRKPQQADRLAPVLAIAVRSIRGPEQRAGLAAIAELAEACPQLHSELAELLPELQLPAPLAEGGASCN